MQKKRVRTGIIGSGFAASFHYEALHRVYRVEIERLGCLFDDPRKKGGLRSEEGDSSL